MIVVVAHPVSHLGRKVLGTSLLVWIGVRSYGIYLWHWPVYMVTRPDLDVGFSGYPLLFAPPGHHRRAGRAVVPPRREADPQRRHRQVDGQLPGVAGRRSATGW